MEMMIDDISRPPFVASSADGHCRESFILYVAYRSLCLYSRPGVDDFGRAERRDENAHFLIDGRRAYYHIIIDLI